MPAETRSLEPEQDTCIARNKQAVMDALANEKYDFRTIRGIADEKGLERSVVETILDKFPHEVRVAAVPNKKGETLYTLRSRPRKLREWVSEGLAFLAGPG